MSDYKDEDTVITTYGSIQLSIEQAYAAGVKTEQQRIVDLFEETIKQCADGAKESCDHCLRMRFYSATVQGDVELQKQIIGFIKAMEGNENE
jgi:hypothetical protein